MLFRSSGARELNALFKVIDRFDRDGNRNTFVAVRDGVTTKAGEIYEAVLRAADVLIDIEPPPIPFSSDRVPTIGAETGRETRVLSDGIERVLNWDLAKLIFTDPSTGKKVEYYDQVGLESMKADLAATTPQEYLPDDPPWSTGSKFFPAGGAGRMASVSVGASFFEGGAYPSSGFFLITVDLKTGKPVKLSSLLSKDQMDAVCATVATKARGTDYDVNDKAIFRSLIDDSFALVADQGKLQIVVDLGNPIHAKGGLVARFRFDAPPDLKDKVKLG